MWTDELREAWRARRHFRAHQLRASLSYTGWAPKKRHYWAARQHGATTTEWQDLLAKPGHDGGLSADVVLTPDGDAHFKQILQALYDTTRPSTMRIWSEAEKDL